ncbi:DUF3422 domain-containing protein [Alsobacter sp. SYSU M60028]|uniref:DUF3422 domain-containing protein n=1 Tax=Alsobacter ponti TaxID=2962936 RepID=A0ABT1LCC2_9HYPH|nr:DUF3422 domain-containing protein [Alsobacter ponti]MCP8939152.1 DUF3422 domain-containing protein [Alsobacter ponti]
MTTAHVRPFALAPHPLRDVVLGEVHARPFHPLESPRRLLHFAFMTDPARAAADRAAVASWCVARGIAAPGEGAKHHRAHWVNGSLRWEQHSEFTTFTWEMSGASDGFTPAAAAVASVMEGIAQPGPLLVAADLHLVVGGDLDELAGLFDPASLAVSQVDGAAVAMTDFRPDAGGFVRILVVDQGLGPARAGALTQRLLEIETYRTLALLGLPEAHRISPRIGEIEAGLTRIASAMQAESGLVTDHKLLGELTALAATLEAESARSSYRFGASRAYDGIVQQRLVAIREREVDGWPSIAAFLSRRMGPAMRTCAMLEDRQARLSEKLSRAANLLRTRVDVEIERQNRDLLSAMNERARMQLRLQQTVEGLSVAAISYYVVGLAGYVFKGAKDAGLLPVDPGMAMAVAVPVAVLGVALVVRRIRRGHGEP